MLQHIFLVYYHYHCKKNQHITRIRIIITLIIRYNNNNNNNNNNNIITIIIIIVIIILMHLSNVLISFTLKTSGFQVIKKKCDKQWWKMIFYGKKYKKYFSQMDS